MELKFMTPTEVWEGFDATTSPLEASIISAKTTNNLVCSKQVFTADSVRDDKLRVECSIYYDARWQDKRPAVLMLPSFENPHSIDAVHKLVEDGFVICTLDYCGVFEDSKTTFPEQWSFAAYPECMKHLDHIETDARNTPWFVWSKIARRAISLLAEQSIVQGDKIGVVGFGIGAQLSYIVTGTDKRVTCMATINGGGYRWAEGNARFDGSDMPSGDEQLAYSTGVGAETYAIFITCPTLLITTRDSVVSDIDRMGDMYELIKSSEKQLLISVSCNPQLTQSSFDTLLGWLRKHLVGAIGTSPNAPTIRFEATDGRLYVKLSCGTNAVERLLYVSYGEPCSAQRHWQTLAVKQKVGEHEYVCDIPVYDKSELLVAYATLTYPDGSVISTKVVSAQGVMSDVTDIDSSPRTSNIIFDGSMGASQFVAKTDDAILGDNSVLISEGPFGIEGVSVAKGSLCLYRSKLEMEAVARSAMLHLDAYSPQKRELLVCAYTDQSLKKHIARATLNGGEFWQKLLFEASDFKSEEGRTLTSLSSVKALEIADVDGIILNNFLWI